MLKTTILSLACFMPIVALVSCTAPKAIVVEPALAPKSEQAAKSEPIAPTRSALPDDGIRLPDMETMPGDDEFRSTKTPPASGDAGSGAVISRPPTEPPARPKPKDD